MAEMNDLDKFEADVARTALEAAGIEPMFRNQLSTRAIELLVSRQ